MKKVPDITNMAFVMFEKMGFLLGESADKADFKIDAEAQPIRGEIKFRGTAFGSLSIVTTKKLAEMLASNILGLSDDEKPDEISVYDAVKEFLNVFCGNILAEMTEKEDSVDLLVPETGRITEEYMKGVVHNPESVFVMVEGEPAAFMFGIKK